MATKINTDLLITMLVVDTAGNKISNDTPFATIKNEESSLYWNGISWVQEESQVSLSIVSNGVYSYNFKPSLVGTLEISMISYNYNIKCIELINVYNDDIDIFEWPINEPYVISVNITGQDEISLASIKRDIDNTYFNGLNWIDEIQWIQMTSSDFFNFSYTFTPNIETSYYITTKTMSGSITSTASYMLNVFDGAEMAVPIILNSRTFKDNTGNTCEVIDGCDYPILGAQVKCYDINNNNKLVASTLTDNTGNWIISVVPGKYYFSFENTGYISKGFEKKIQ